MKKLIQRAFIAGITYTSIITIALFGIRDLFDLDGEFPYIIIGIYAIAGIAIEIMEKINLK